MEKPHTYAEFACSHSLRNKIVSIYFRKKPKNCVKNYMDRLQLKYLCTSISLLFCRIR